MDFAEIVRLIILAQESINAITTVRAERHRILKLIQLAEDNSTELTPEIIATELDDLKQTIEDAKAALPDDPLNQE